MPTASKRQRLSSVDRRTPEERFLAFGGGGSEDFGLHNAKSKEGIEARAGLNYLLAQVKAPGNYAVQARNILQSCANTGVQPLSWHDLMALPSDYWLVTIPLLHYVRRTGGIDRNDFEDEGREFFRLVFPEHEGCSATAKGEP